MIASARDISLEQVLRIVFAILSGPLALCYLGVFQPLQCLWSCFQYWGIWDVT